VPSESPHPNPLLREEREKKVASAVNGRGQIVPSLERKMARVRVK
jgi:hypothetical protein